MGQLRAMTGEVGRPMRSVEGLWAGLAASFDLLSAPAGPETIQMKAFQPRMTILGAMLTSWHADVVACCAGT